MPWHPPSCQVPAEAPQLQGNQCISAFCCTANADCSTSCCNAASHCAPVPLLLWLFFSPPNAHMCISSCCRLPSASQRTAASIQKKCNPLILVGSCVPSRHVLSACATVLHALSVASLTPHTFTFVFRSPVLVDEGCAAASALVAGRSIPPQGAATAGRGSSQKLTRRLSTAG